MSKMIHYVDPALLVFSDSTPIHIQRTKLKEIIFFLNTLNSIEKFLPDGSRLKLIKIPITKDIEDYYFNNPPANTINERLRKIYWAKFRTGFDRRKYICQKTNIENEEEIYTNTNNQISQLFDSLLLTCNYNNFCCISQESNKKLKIPFLKSKESVISSKFEEKLEIYDNFSDVYLKINPLFFYPEREMSLELKEILFKTIISILLIRQKIEYDLKNLNFKDQFLERDEIFLKEKGLEFRNLIIDTLLAIINKIFKPETRNIGKRLKHWKRQFITHNNKKLKIYQIDILKVYYIGKNKMNPRIHFCVSGKKICILRYFDKLTI